MTHFSVDQSWEARVGLVARWRQVGGAAAAVATEEGEGIHSVLTPPAVHLSSILVAWERRGLTLPLFLRLPRWHDAADAEPDDEHGLHVRRRRDGYVSLWWR